MKFRKSSAYNLVSECGEYAIAKVIVQGAVQYEAWHRTSAVTDLIASQKATSHECIEICRQHAQKRAAA